MTAGQACNLSYVTSFLAREKVFFLEARASAERLAKLTGLPIRDYPNRVFNRQALLNDDESEQ